jgi:hypothetical protein
MAVRLPITYRRRAIPIKFIWSFKVEAGVGALTLFQRPLSPVCREVKLILEAPKITPRPYPLPTVSFPSTTKTTSRTGPESSSNTAQALVTRALEKTPSHTKAPTFSSEATTSQSPFSTRWKRTTNSSQAPPTSLSAEIQQEDWLYSYGQITSMTESRTVRFGRFRTVAYS